VRLLRVPVALREVKALLPKEVGSLSLYGTSVQAEASRLAWFECTKKLQDYLQIPTVG